MYNFIANNCWTN